MVLEAFAGSPSPATLYGFRPVGSFPTSPSCHGPRFFPKCLFFLSFLVLLGFGEMHVVFLRFMAKSVQVGFVVEW